MLRKFRTLTHCSRSQLSMSAFEDGCCPLSCTAALSCSALSSLSHCCRIYLRMLSGSQHHLVQYISTGVPDSRPREDRAFYETSAWSKSASYRSMTFWFSRQACQASMLQQSDLNMRKARGWEGPSMYRNPTHHQRRNRFTKSGSCRAPGAANTTTTCASKKW